MMFDVHVTILCCEIMYSYTISMLEFNVNTVHCVMLIIVLMRRVMFILVPIQYDWMNKGR